MTSNLKSYLNLKTRNSSYFQIQNKTFLFKNKVCYNKDKLNDLTSKRLKEVRLLAEKIFHAAEDHKAESLKWLDLTGTCDYADVFIIMSATSERHARSLADAIVENFKNDVNDLEGYQTGEWILVDLGDIIVHIFQEDIRLHYNFDKLWGHAKVVTTPNHREKKIPESRFQSVLA